MAARLAFTLLLSQFFLFAGAMPSDNAKPTCGTHITLERAAQVEAELRRIFNVVAHPQPNITEAPNQPQPQVQESAPLPPPPPLAVPVYFNIITKANGAGSVTDAQINGVMTAMNTNYKPTGLMTFILVGVNRVVNNDWFDNAGPGTAQQTAMKTALRKGAESALNIYSVGFTSQGGLNGYSTFPWDYATHPFDDGIVSSNLIISGVGRPGYDKFVSVVHEVGHWAGLYHTFQGGCAASSDNGGDYVSDTSAQGSPTYGSAPACAQNRDSCPKIPGIDPQSNIMDYGVDACRTQFTPGQVTRAKAVLRAYRGSH